MKSKSAENCLPGFPEWAFLKWAMLGALSIAVVMSCSQSPDADGGATSERSESTYEKANAELDRIERQIMERRAAQSRARSGSRPRRLPPNVADFVRSRFPDPKHRRSAEWIAEAHLLILEWAETQTVSVEGVQKALAVSINCATLTLDPLDLSDFVSELREKMFDTVEKLQIAMVFERQLGRLATISDFGMNPPDADTCNRRENRP